MNINECSDALRIVVIFCGRFRWGVGGGPANLADILGFRGAPGTHFRPKTDAKVGKIVV